MIRTGRIQSIALAVLVVAVVSACGESPSGTSQTTDGATGSRPAEQPRGDTVPPHMVSAVSASRSALVISVHFALGAQPAVGSPLPVEIAVVPHRPFTAVGAHFDGQDGLTVTAGAQMPVQRDVKAEKILVHKVELRPEREGLYMVTAAVETESDEGTITRVYSIPVIVTAPAQ